VRNDFGVNYERGNDDALCGAGTWNIVQKIQMDIQDIHVLV
jgi:hypothetical protein